MSSKPTLKPTLRLDIQGLRMIAVVLVLLAHIFGWPAGGFIGVDVFFVISGFLITGILLRDAEKHGHVSFVGFYRRRIRRIVPAATLTLVAIAATAWLMFAPTRAAQTWWDTLAAFFFVSNWRFASLGTDYFTFDGPLSPVRHFWSLSVEEQFYFVWPAIMAAIVYLAARRAETTRRRIAGTLMGILIAVSYGWAVIDTAHAPTWSYFSTLTRAWELGAGALIAIFAPTMTRIPDTVRPVVAWLGLVVIMFGAVWITEDKGFPGPWAAIPVIGTALVIIAGTEGPTRFLWPITNPAAVKIGDLSYSLYLWHWPVLIFLGTAYDLSWRYYIAATTITAALSAFSYYYIEQPILASSWLKPRDQQTWRRPPSRRERRRRERWRRNLASRITFEMSRDRQLAGLTALALLLAGLWPLSTAPRELPAYIPAAAVDATTEQPLPPALAALQKQLTDAVKATAWPDFQPPLETVLDGPMAEPELLKCSNRLVEIDCWFGNKTAPHTIVIAGDSVAMSYLRPLITFVENSGGQWKLLNRAIMACPLFAADLKNNLDGNAESCRRRKQVTVDTINRIRPDVVLISNSYGRLTDNTTGQILTDEELQTTQQQIISQFSGSVGRIALLTAPPAGQAPAECYSPDVSPTECVGEPDPDHKARTRADSLVAESFPNGELIDTQLLFCTQTGYCPMFVGTTLLKYDGRHITPQYAILMAPAFDEMLKSSTTFSPTP